MDLTAALLGIALFAPLLPVVAVAIKLESRGPLFTRRLRVGVERRAARSEQRGSRRVHDIGGAMFVARSFRVMAVGGRRRRTWVGTWLERAGVVAWPQLFNVLRGDMSIVGPRALPPRIADRLRRELSGPSTVLRDVRPGVFPPARARRNERTTFWTILAERVLVDAPYARRLRDARGVVEVLVLDLRQLGGSLVRAWGSRHVFGNDVIQFRLPTDFDQVQLDGSTLAECTPRGMGSEHHVAEQRLIAWWYPPRTHGWVGLASHDCSFAATPDGSHAPAGAEGRVARSHDGRRVVVSTALEPGADGEDRLSIDLPASLADVDHVCGQLAQLWSALAPRTGEPAYATRMNHAILDGLGLLASSARAPSPGAERIAVDVHVAHDRLELSMERRSGVPDVRAGEHAAPALTLEAV